MKKKIFLYPFLIFIFFGFLGSSLLFSQQESPPLPPLENLKKLPVVDYQIEARLFPEKKMVEGKEILTWFNDSEKAVSELQFHLYLNAFKNNRSTFMKESGGAHRGFQLGEKWGYIDVQRIKMKDGPDLIEAVEYIHPDDDNEHDQTVMRVSLPSPVPPQSSITLYIEFDSKLPRVFSRSGYYKDFFMVAQWFPKIGVLWNGEWNCHQYHAHSEYFADFGTYEVDITVPEKYVVGATGKRVEEKKNEDGTLTYTYYQEKVHDFAWTACPDFVEIREQYVQKNPPVDTEMIFLIYRPHINQKERYIESLRNGIEFYSTHYGSYPYSTITLVDPPMRAQGAGGMEYPTLFTGGTMSWLPEGIRLTELVTIHEFGHNYWYGMIGFNEFEEPWLDEGINSYSELKAMTQYYGENTSVVDLGGLEVGDIDQSRVQVMASSTLDPILKKAWEFYNGSSYSINSYSKAALMLLTLEKYLGEDVMAEVMRTFFERWKFRHPTSSDFIQAAEEVSGQDLGWFFDQFLKTPGRLDYAVGRIQCREIKEAQGIFGEPEEDKEKEKKGAGAESREEPQKKAKKQEPIKKEKKEEKEEKKMYRNEVDVVRKGNWIFPQKIQVTFENGRKVWEEWDGKSRWKRFVYKKPYKIQSVQLDPQSQMFLDVNLTNNSRTLEPQTKTPLKYALSWMVKFQHFLSLFSL